MLIPQAVRLLLRLLTHFKQPLTALPRRLVGRRRLTRQLLHFDMLCGSGSVL